MFLRRSSLCRASPEVSAALHGPETGTPGRQRLQTAPSCNRAQRPKTIKGPATTGPSLSPVTLSPLQAPSRGAML